MAGTTEQDYAPEAGAQGERHPPRTDGEREHTLTEAFVSIANALVEGHNIIDVYLGLTEDCTRLLQVTSAGLLLADPQGQLKVVAASAERTRDLELFMLQANQGPCLECYITETPVLVPDLAAEQDRWPRFAPVAVAAGFASVHALPMRLRDTTLGVLGLFNTRTGSLGPEDLLLAQALAHVASIALAAGKASAEKSALNAQLQTALNSRVILEQAKGILAQLGDLDTDEAFTVLRRYSRDHNQKLADIAHAVVTRRPLAGAVLAHAKAKGLLPGGRSGPGRSGDPARERPATG